MTAKSEIVRLLELLLDGNQLKRIPRSGWLLRGVGPAETESVAEHTCGTALTALFLTELIDEEIDMARLLAMCLLHDLPETQLMDLPPSAARHLTPAGKRQAEESALHCLLSGVRASQELHALWTEFEEASSVEGRLARDADKLEMMIQAACYERAGRHGLDEFWETSAQYSWEFPASRELFDELRAQRPLKHQLRTAEYDEHERTSGKG